MEMAQTGHDMQLGKMVTNFGQKMAKFCQNKQKSRILEKFLQKMYFPKMTKFCHNKQKSSILEKI